MRANAPHGPMAEINVTPLVDVMLVLLVIFMVTSPLLVQSDVMKLKLPSAATIDKSSETKIVIAVTADEQILLDGQPVEVEMLAPQLKQLLQKDLQKLVVFEGDERIPYSLFIKVMDSVRLCGVQHLDLAHVSTNSQKKP